MAIDEQGLRDRLDQLIGRSGLTKGEFATRIGIDGPKLSKTLSGQRRLTPYELAAAAELGGVETAWLLKGEEASSVAAAARTSGDEAPSKALSVARGLDKVARLLESKGAILEPVSLKPASRPEVSGGAVSEGAQLAVWARRYLCDIESDQAATITELEEVCEEAFGVNVVVRDVDDHLDGLSWVRGNFRLALVNNVGRHWTRQRFTLAHELAHILFSDKQLLVDENVMGPESRSNPIEMRANSFAASFLMPESQVRAFWSSSEGREDAVFSQMLGEFGVSPSALTWRLFNLDLINDRRRLALASMDLRRAAVVGDWFPVYDRRGREQSVSRAPGLLGDAARSAYADGIIGVRPLATTLDRDVDELLDLPSGGASDEAGAPASISSEDPVFSP